MTISRTCLSTLILIQLSPLKALSQDVPSAAMPKDPAALLSLGHERNGLNSPDVKPWHIRGNYTFYDSDGKVEDTGVYEEWWVSENQYKRSFFGTNFAQVEFATGHGLFRTGSQAMPNASAMMLRTSLIQPLLESELLKEFKLKQHHESIEKGKYDCVTLGYPLRQNLSVPDDFFPRSCFDATQPILRINTLGSYVQMVYNKVILFQGHYLARELHVYFGNKPKVDFTLDVVEPLNEPLNPGLAPPPEALPVDLSKGAISLSAGAVVPYLIRHEVPEYPASAKERRIQGTVVIQVSIGKDGHPATLDAISGPTELREPALDAVRQWVYRPFEVMGEPTVVNTVVNVIFTLG